MGIAVGTLMAYSLTLRGLGVLSDPRRPASILSAPWLAEIPRFDKGGSNVPVRDAPTDTVAEAFRFGASSMELAVAKRLARNDADDGGGRPAGTTAPIVAVVSGGKGDGRSAMVANLSLALAAQGHRVLAVDAHLGGQGLCRLLAPGASTRPGLLDVLTSAIPVEEAAMELAVSGGPSITLVPSGGEAAASPAPLQSPAAAEFFGSAAGQFDFVLVDTPPLLSAAYAGDVVHHCDWAVVVVPSASPVSAVADVAARLDLVNSPVLGYLYNDAPRRRRRYGV
jgi:Mrp family chromosome partitioning ATPase